MFISVHHNIADPGQFWASAQKSLPELPVAGVQRIINVFPSTAVIFMDGSNEL